jgi:PKD repeat protein
MKKQLIIIGIVAILVGVGLNGCTETKNYSPTATISADKTSGEIYLLANLFLTVQFTGSGIDSDGTIVSYYWDFDDGETNDTQNPSHTFTEVGTYNVTLTVTDDDYTTAIDEITIIALGHTTETWHFVENFSGIGNRDFVNDDIDPVYFLINTYSTKWKVEWTVYPEPNYEQGFFNIGLVRYVPTNPYRYEKPFFEWNLGDTTSGIVENTDNQFGYGIIYFRITATSVMNWTFDVYEWW